MLVASLLMYTGPSVLVPLALLLVSQPYPATLWLQGLALQPCNPACQSLQLTACAQAVTVYACVYLQPCAPWLQPHVYLLPARRPSLRAARCYP